jgi:hypothetical protein
MLKRMFGPKRDEYEEAGEHSIMGSIELHLSAKCN